MMNKRLAEYRDAANELSRTLKSRVPGVETTEGAADAPVYADYNHRDDASDVPTAEMPVLVCTNSAGTGTLALIPVALFAEGEVVALAALSGSLAPKVRESYLEAMLLDSARWVLVGKRPTFTRRYTTTDLRRVFEQVLSGKR